MALDDRGAYFAIEITGRQVLIGHHSSKSEFKPVIIDLAQHEMTDAVASGAGTAPVSVLALNFDDHLLTVGTGDGSITVYDIQQNHAVISLPVADTDFGPGVQAVALSHGGRFLVAADDKKHVWVWKISTHETYRKIDYYGATVSALAVGSSGSPVVIGDTAGQVSVWGRLRPPLSWHLQPSSDYTAGQASGWGRFHPPLCPVFPGGAVKSLSLPYDQPTQLVVVGFAEGEIYCLRFHGKLAAKELETVKGQPVRAVAMAMGSYYYANESALPNIYSVTAITDADPWLYSWKSEELTLTPEVLRHPIKAVTNWWRELGALLFAFADQCENISAEVAQGRADMLKQLKDLDEATRDRIRPVVVTSAVSIYDSYSFELAAFKVWEANLLSKAAFWVTAFLLVFIILLSPLVNDLSSLHGIASWLAAAGTLAAVGWMLHVLRRLGLVGRAFRIFVAVVGVTILLLGNRIAFTTPRDLVKPMHEWFHTAGAPSFRFDIPYPLWLGLVYAAVIFIVIGAVRLALRYIRTPSAVSMRRDALAGGLLQALINIACLAQWMVDDPDLAASRNARGNLQRLLRLAAHIASTDWGAALRTGYKRADRMIRDQGYVIAAAIQQWERDAALGGPQQLKELSKASTKAVVDAADGKWEDLMGAKGTQIPNVKRIRASAVVGQGLSLVRQPPFAS